MTTISIMGGGAAQSEINVAPAKKRGRPRKVPTVSAQIIVLRPSLNAAEFIQGEAEYRSCSVESLANPDHRTFIYLYYPRDKYTLSQVSAAVSCLRDLESFSLYAHLNGLLSGAINLTGYAQLRKPVHQAYMRERVLSGRFDVGMAEAVTRLLLHFEDYLQNIRWGRSELPCAKVVNLAVRAVRYG